MKTSLPPCFTRRGFTLIELLVVIAIIGILAGILLPAIGKAQVRAKVKLAQVDMKNLVGAVHTYKADYGRLPANTGNNSAHFLGTMAATPGRDCTYGTTGLMAVPVGLTVINGGPYEANNSAVIAVVGDFVTTPGGAPTINANHALNPRRNVTFTGKMSSGDDTAPTPGVNMDLVYRDPWGMPYFITLDVNYDGICYDAFYRLALVSQKSGSTGFNGTFNSVGSGDNFGVREEAVAWSVGPDKVANPAVSGDLNASASNANTDNIISW